MANSRWEPRQHRGLAIARRGMVATAHPLASAAGLQILREGGNAADAILASAATLGVTLGSTNSLGGDMFCLYYDAKTRSVTGFNGNGPAGSGATLEAMRALGLKQMPARGPLTVTVPGAVDGYCELNKRFGTMPLSRLFADAIQYAEDGHPIGQQISRIINNAAKELKDEVEWAKVYLPNGRPPRPGENFVQKDYAWSLRQVAEGGRDAFYEGEPAKRMLAALEARGGLLTAEDLKKHRTEVYSPISTTYRGKTVYETQPPSQGFIVLEMLNLLEPENLKSMGWGSAEAIHRMVEAKKLAFADRWEFMGDPRFVDVPTETLIDKRYAADRRRAIDPNRAMATAPAGSPREVAADTTYLCAVDGQGNAASFIHTIYAQFGSGVVAGGTGITFTNRGRAFVLDETHPNRIMPGKRTMHTLNCYLLTQDDDLALVGGTPGADSQPQWNVQVLTDLLDFGLNEQEAAESPKWISTPGTVPSEMDAPFVLEMEDGFGPEVVSQLERMGHRVDLRPRYGLRGSVQIIRHDPETGALFGASDPRERRAGDRLLTAMDPPEAGSPPVITIEGELVALGPIRRDLAPLYQRWFNDLRTLRTIGQAPVPQTLESEERWFDSRLAAANVVSFTAYERRTMRPIGNTDLRDIDHRNRSAEFGITIGEPDARGKGFGTEVARLMLDYAFTALGLNTVMLRVAEFNLAGRRAYEKAGFREIGRRRQSHMMGGKLWDAIYMDCLAGEFRSPVLSRIFTPDEQRGT